MAEDDDDERVIVVDRGTHVSRLGWSHLTEPSVVTPTRGRDWKALLLDCQEELGVGDRAHFSRHPVLLAESVLDRDESQWYDLALGLFTFLGVRAACVVNTAALSLLASGRTTGLVVDLGAAVSQIVPVYEGHVVRAAARTWDVAGEDLDSHTLSMVRGLTSDLNPSEAARTVKEWYGEVALHYASQVRDRDADLTAPFGAYTVNAQLGSEVPREVEVRGEAFKIPEVYFKPRQCGKFKTQGLPRAVVDVVQRCPPDIQRRMYRNIFLAGQGSLFAGLQVRLKAELACMVPDHFEVEVRRVQGHEDNMSAYLGGVQLASSQWFRHMCLSGEEFNDPDDSSGLASGHMLGAMFG